MTNVGVSDRRSHQQEIVFDRAAEDVPGRQQIHATFLPVGIEREDFGRTIQLKREIRLRQQHTLRNAGRARSIDDGRQIFGRPALNARGDFVADGRLFEDQIFPPIDQVAEGDRSSRMLFGNVIV